MTLPEDKPKRTLLLVLAGSLLLNMFLIGFMVARWTMAPGPPLRPSPMHGTPGMHIGPRSARAGGGAVMRKLMAEHRPALRKHRQAIHEARRNVRDALIAEPFDPAALSAALEALRSATSGAQAALHESLVSAAPKLSAEERARLSRAHRLWSGPGRRPGKHGPPRRPPHRRPPTPRP